MKTSTLATIGLSLLGWTATNAATVTPDVIFGSGNSNGNFTVTQVSGVEIGLRAKQRFPIPDDNFQPTDNYSYDGVDTYTFPNGQNGTFGFVTPLDGVNTPVWSFDWSINTDFLDSSGEVLSDFTYVLSLDADPSAGVNALTFDPINSSNPNFGEVRWDHAIGTNATGNGGGGNFVADETTYANALTANNVAQNSWNYEFFDEVAPLSSFAPVNGTYEISLEVFDSLSNSVGKTTINVVMIPEPATAIGGLLCVAGLGFRRRLR